MPLNTQELMRQVGKIRITTTRLVNQYLGGEYQSVFKGQGIEFEEVREYVAGDDVRAIDWNVTARMGHPFVKRFREERELTILFLADVSGSQCFGSGLRTKAELTAEATCLLALSAIRNNDRIGLVLFSDRVEKYLSPRKGRTAAMRLVREVLAAAPTRRGTNIAEALRFLGRVQKRAAVVFLISDFMDQGYDRELRAAARKHDLVCVPVSDPRETELSPADLIEIEDPETGRLLWLDSRSRAVRREFRRRAEQSRLQLAETLRRRRIDSIWLSTDAPCVEDIRRLFHERQRRTRRT
jgi:uncharacterized protein (DUF58 family)